VAEEKQAESIGAKLHKARLKKRVSVEQVYKDIKIHPKLVTALEEDRYDDFLSPTYIKAFLKNYCRYLEIDANRILADYDSARTESKKTEAFVRPPEKIDITTNVSWAKYIAAAKKWLLPVLSGIIALFLCLYIISLASKAVKKIKGANTASPKTEIKEQLDKKSSLYLKALSIPKEQPLPLAIKTKNDVWLEVKSDGKTVFKSILKKGSRETYKARERFQLWTGKGEFLDLNLNGNPLGSPGDGVIKNIILTHEGLNIEKL